jgi:hypothetical protein
MLVAGGRYSLPQVALGAHLIMNRKRITQPDENSEKNWENSYGPAQARYDFS